MSRCSSPSLDGATEVEESEARLVRQSLSRLRQQCAAIYELRSELQATQRERDELRGRLEAAQASHRDEAAALRRDVETLAGQSARLAEENESTKAQLEALQAEHRRVAADAQAAVGTLRQSLGEAGRATASAEERVALVSRQLARAQLAAASAQQTAHDTAEAQRRSEALMHEELSRTRAALGAAEARCRDLQSQRIAREKVARLEEQLRAAHEENGALVEKAAALAEERRAAEKRLGRVAAAWEAERRLHSGKNQENEDLLRQFAAAESQLSAALDDRRAAEPDLDSEAALRGLPLSLPRQERSAAASPGNVTAAEAPSPKTELRALLGELSTPKPQRAAGKRARRLKRREKGLRARAPAPAGGRSPLGRSAAGRAGDSRRGEAPRAGKSGGSAAEAVRASRGLDRLLEEWRHIAQEEAPEGEGDGGAHARLLAEGGEALVGSAPSATWKDAA